MHLFATGWLQEARQPKVALVGLKPCLIADSAEPNDNINGVVKDIS